jgi:hypothetical protein
MQILIFHPDARQEIRDATIFYENAREGLGATFLEAVEYALWLIWTNTFGWKKIRGEVRRCLLKKFPYGIIYRADATRVFVLAVMHLHRRPNYWVKRLDDGPS